MMDKFYSSLIIIIFILFQEDIRTVLSRMGKKPFLSNTETISSKIILDEITRAAASLASKKVGALIAIERNILLHRYAESGIVIDAKISQEILMSIFHTTSPIHDGAVLILQGRLAAAGCFLPLTRDENIDPDMGTRHRAAIGLSQETDALVVVVSEEKGAISLCVDGEMTRGLSAKELRKAMRMHLTQTKKESSKKKLSGNRARSLWNRFRTNGKLKSEEK
jgi:diadenylate cyclase